jgi:ABC-type transport system involved in cytochrome c biogenesis permease subunit
MKKYFPWIMAVALAGWALGSLRIPGDKTWAVREFGRLPVMFGGRVQPIDSLARNSLLQIREKQTANLEPWKNFWEKPKLIPATEWAMFVMMKPEVADAWPVFRIDHPEVKSLLGLPDEPDLINHIDGKHFSWNQIAPKFSELRREAMRANEKEASQRNTYDQALLHLWNARTVYARLKNTLGPARTGDIESGIAEFNPKFEAGRAAWMSQMRGEKDFDQASLQWISDQLDTPIVIPASAPETGRRTDNWKRMFEAAVRAHNEGGSLPAPVLAYASMAKAFRADDVAGFNQAVANYRSELSAGFQPELKKASREQRFNFAEPFYKALVLYVGAFLFVLVYWISPREWLRQGALACAIVALLVHSSGLVTRMWLEGRPPVTNLYSSAVFIGWGACVLGLILEKFWRNSIGLIVSSGVGFITLIIAHHLALSGDTMEMLQAVLDTNFWLATHVVAVTLGYASTFVAGVLGITYIIRGVFTKAITPEFGRSLAKMAFGIICFATLFSFVGTVLGGIWADQSWGRFWGWDPKENGALIIVLWNALILHARWAGVVRERGLMTMTVVGNIVTSWSWFGVNMLGVGLHSYGFMGAAFKWLMAFVVSQLVLIALGSLPLKFWKSFRSNDEPPRRVPDAREAATA